MATKKKLLQAASGVSTGVPGAWDLAYAFPDDPNTYVTTGGAVSDSSSGVFTSEGSNPFAVFFKPDGTKMYVIISAGSSSADNDTVFQYSLSTAWDVTTKSYDSKKFSFASQETSPWGLWFKPDGTKMYMSGSLNDTLFQYSLSTAWDVSTASYDSVSVDLGSFAGDTIDTLAGFYFKDDGTEFYCVDVGNDDVHHFTLSTAWDLTASNWTRQTDLYIGGEESSPSGIALSPDGKYMTLLGYAGDDLNTYVLSTEWDTSTATLVNNSQAYVGGVENSPRNFVYGDEGRAIFFTGTATDQVYKWYVGGWSFTSEGLIPVDIAFNDDGTIMYILDDTGNDINYYNLTTPYDTSESNVVVDGTKRFDQNASNPKAFDFKADGTSFYVSSENEITQYDMSTAWDTSTASTGSTFNHTPTGAHGMRFRPDGTQVFVNYQADDTVKALNLSTAWDISTASYATGQSFDYSTQTANAWGIEFKPDGKKLYIHAESNDYIYQYSLSTAWDLTTASYDNTSYDARTKIGNVSPAGIRFKPDGTKLFYIDGNEDRIIRIGVEDTS